MIETPVKGILKKPGREPKDKSPVHISMTTTIENDGSIIGERDRKSIVRKGTGHRKRPSGSPIVRQKNQLQAEKLTTDSKDEQTQDENHPNLDDDQNQNPGNFPTTSPEPANSPSLLSPSPSQYSTTPTNLSPSPTVVVTSPRSIHTVISSQSVPNLTSSHSPQSPYISIHTSPPKVSQNPQSSPKSAQNPQKTTNSPLIEKRKFGLTRSITHNPSTLTPEIQLLNQNLTQTQTPNIRVRRSDSMMDIKNEPNQDGTCIIS